MPSRKSTDPQPGWECENCGTAYRLKVFTCPRCHGTRFTEVSGMAKISTFGGVSDVKVSGLLPGVAGEIPEKTVVRADGTTDIVNGEVNEVEPVTEDDPDTAVDPEQVDESDGARGGDVENEDGLPATTAERAAADAPPLGQSVREKGVPTDGTELGQSVRGADAEPKVGQSGQESDVDRADDPPFDPGDFTVAEVKDKLDGLADDDREKVIAAERAGKNRTGITG